MDISALPLIGEGMRRRVYALSDTQVLKVDKEGEAENKNEWAVWLSVKDTDRAIWFAPCIELTEHGLVMTRTAPLDEHPEQIPEYFGDVKYHNWDSLDGRPVCHDYQYLVYGDGMKRAMWG